MIKKLPHNHGLIGVQKTASWLRSSKSAKRGVSGGTVGDAQPVCHAQKFMSHAGLSETVIRADDADMLRRLHGNSEHACELRKTW